MQILRFDELDSTNAYAKRHCSLLADKTIITARRQTAGRGRLDRKWISQEGGLYFSLILKPHKTDFLPHLTQLMALCVCDVLRAHQARAYLKWPNDVLVNQQKICGILSQALFEKEHFQALILGVGLNRAQTDMSQAGQPAVSLKLLGIDIDEEPLLQEILQRFFDNYNAVIENGFETIRASYLAYFAYLQKEVKVQNGPQTITGIVKTISPKGQLVLQTPKGVFEISIGDMMV